MLGISKGISGGLFETKDKNTRNVIATIICPFYE
jgi:hypothetical protein